MEFKKVKISEFLAERKGRYKPNSSEISNLKRIDKIDFSGKIYFSEKSSRTDMILIKNGDLVISGINVEKGAMSVYDGKDAVVATIHYSSYTYNKDKIDLDFLKHFLKSQNFKKALKEQVPGGIKTEIKPRHLLSLEILIPTKIDDQKLVVKRLDNLNSNLEDVSLELSNHLSLINQLRQSFLREAMQGTLVSNETTEGKTGSDLLQEIKAEKEKLIKEKKLKKSKPLPPISEEEIPFEIPENWVWCRLGEVINLISGQDLMPSQYNDKEIGIPYITGASNLENQKVLVNRWTDTPKSIAKNGDLLLTCKGSGVGKTAMLDINEAHIARQIMSIQTINSPLGYIYLIVKSSVNFFRSKSKSLIPGIDRDTVLNLVIPFPPLEIQEKIVTKLDELMQYCDDLEASVKESQTYNEQLLQQVLREALEGKKEEVAEPVLMVAEEKPIFQINSVTSKTCDDNDMVILAGYIIKKLNTKDFGRVKLQKMLHLVEYHCKLETNIYYQQKVAGPHSEYLKNTIEPKLKRYRYFEIHKEKLTVNEKITYTALSSSSEIESLLSKEFKDQKQTIDDLLNKFYNKPTRHCELISTMYAVWNNRILSKKPFSDEDLKQDFLKWDKEKVKFNDNLDYAIDWIRKEALEPKGWGKVIGKL